MRIGILGYGEVGKSIASFYENPQIKDLDRDDFSGKAMDFLHICIPYSEKFIDIVYENSKFVGSGGAIIVNSTVPLGTTELLFKKCSVGVVHSPVRGTHPNISEGLRTFVKYIGADRDEDAITVKRHFDMIGIQSKIVKGSRNTEALKLWSTTQYAFYVVLEKEMYRWCKENDVNYEIVYQDESKTYNQGFRECGYNYFQRPILKHMEGEIGGHCLQSNAVILHESGERAITPIVLKEGQILSPSENPLENKTWLYCEYHGKKKSLQEIGDSIERTGENIGQWMRKHNIKRRDRTWTDEDLNKIIELHKKGLTFKEIADEMEDRTYESVRNIAYKVLDLDSNYNPGIRDEKTRQKISASLQGIEQKEWEEFKENANSLIRKSCQYIEWRDNVYKRDNYICQKCKDKSKTYFHAHHIKSFAKYPELRFDINNGITLCVECHKKEHFPNDKD